MCKYQIIVCLCLVGLLFISCSTTKLVSINVLDCGAIANDNLPDDNAFKMALKKYNKILIPEGEYHLSNLSIPDNKILQGLGRKTKLIKTKGQDGSIINVNGNNITIENISFYGNLFNESGEWNHAINIRPINLIFKNINIINVKTIKMHGDGICIGAYQGNVENVEIKNFESDSCYRNGISITAGKNISIKNAIIRNSGMFGIDLEIDNGSKDNIEDVTLEESTTCKIAIVGEGKNIINNVRVKNVIVDQNLFANLYPVPGKPPFHPESILLRSCKNILFDNIIFKNSKYGLVKVIEGASDKNTNNIKFQKIYSNSLTNTTNTVLIIAPAEMINFERVLHIKPIKKEKIEQ